MVHQALAPGFGALVEGIDLAALDCAGFRQLYALWQRQHLLVLRGHGLDREGFQAWAARFGQVDPLPELAGVETRWGVELPWAERPPFACLLHARRVPENGGATWFACLPAALRLIAPDLVARLRWLAIQHGPNVHPVVIMQPETGEHSLFLGSRADARIVDVPQAESERILNIAWSYGTADAVTLCHRWQAGDIVLWNNLTVMHRHEAVPAGSTRKLQRVRIQGRYILAAPIQKEAA
ncbi:MAG TPA: TauD/TfdA family dioxygenase [Ramlibacter sp.]|uniref:TauD/TfdA dioxygenase family protein n=1 Tax=Ramlibacter sp. TaxID=1917967 RepID=UPI002D7F6014|nr:TauD/TfdA family dioxygenase [Ramlibacter sp.]HET8746661.1 TauD/TfdA family dioxygenase [Ramlibacter sp.]